MHGNEQLLALTGTATQVDSLSLSLIHTLYIYIYMYIYHSLSSLSLSLSCTYTHYAAYLSLLIISRAHTNIMSAIGPHGVLCIAAYRASLVLGPS